MRNLMLFLEMDSRIIVTSTLTLAWICKELTHQPLLQHSLTCETKLVDVIKIECKMIITLGHEGKMIGKLPIKVWGKF